MQRRIQSNPIHRPDRSAVFLKLSHWSEKEKKDESDENMRKSIKKGGKKGMDGETKEKSIRKGGGGGREKGLKSEKNK